MIDKVGGAIIKDKKILDVTKYIKKDDEYTVFSKVYNAEKVEEPSHVDLVTKAIVRGFSDNDFLALSTSTWDPFTIEIYPELNEDIKKRITKRIKIDIGNMIEEHKSKQLLDILTKKTK